MVHQPRSVILKTKTTLPGARPGSVRRNHLLNRLDEGLFCKLTILCAPAGYGKTTLLTQWAHQQSAKPAWLSLDEMDNDLIRFWKYVVHTIADSRLPELAERLEPLMGAVSHTSIFTFIDSLLYELDSIEQPVILLLDDYHAIFEEQIHLSLSYFIDYLPGHVHLFIASRNALPFSTAKWTLRGQACHISLEQLRFTHQETASFYHDSHGISLHPQQIERILERTEGWVAGLQLAAISLTNPVHHDRFFDGFNGSHHNITEYLLHEVWLRLPADLQDFLLATCILKRMDAPLCNRLTNQTQSHQILTFLHRQNIFLIPLDDYHSWYRYHHLFGDFLEGQLQRRDPQKAVDLHRIASAAFAERGLYDEAIDHAFAAFDFSVAAQLLEKHFPQMIARGELSTLLHWLTRFPQPAEMLPPSMRLLSAFIQILCGQAEQAQKELPSLEATCAAIEDPVEQEQFVSGLFFVRANLIFALGQFETLISGADTFYKALPENPLFFSFNYNATEPFIRRTTLGLKGMLSPQTEFVGNMFSGILAAHGWQDSLFNMYVMMALAEGYYEWNRLEESAALLEQIEPIARRRKIPGLLVPCLLTKAKIALATGASIQARGIVEEALETIHMWSEDYWANPLRAFLARVHLADGHISLAMEQLDKLPSFIREKPMLQRELELLTLVRSLLAKQEGEDVFWILDTLKMASKREGLLTSQVDIAILQALAKQQLGQIEEAKAYLQEALVIGEANGYVRSFLDDGPALYPLLAACRANKGKQPHHKAASPSYVMQLLDLLSKTDTKRKTDHSSPLLEPLTGKEMILLSMLSQGASNKEIAEQLGNTVGTVKVYLHRIYGKLGVTNRTQALLKAQELSLQETDPAPH
ncbi:LuxR C-terminal-related transcriptional regulator [Brevibacillus choshinensis]|uniref:Transcriptional regulator n=1 Tax=Brevibacillus choshinensis TaxID=54911 RepID=A0ABX7FLX4_BRECH|nr:LuxR C-terminal-related transcriptional regulator [Brevibacillus choshinensis]QRG66650.1 transcriptional regulator [Brevibacillus choshinensis]